MKTVIPLTIAGLLGLALAGNALAYVSKVTFENKSKLTICLKEITGGQMQSCGPVSVKYDCSALGGIELAPGDINNQLQLNTGKTVTDYNYAMLCMYTAGQFYNSQGQGGLALSITKATPPNYAIHYTGSIQYNVHPGQGDQLPSFSLDATGSSPQYASPVNCEADYRGCSIGPASSSTGGADFSNQVIKVTLSGGSLGESN